MVVGSFACGDSGGNTTETSETASTETTTDEGGPTATSDAATSQGTSTTDTTTTDETSATGTTTAATDGEMGWQLVWSDEFDGTSINSQRWSFEVNCWGGGNGEQQCYTDRSENAWVSDGALHIQARRENFSGPAEPEDWGTNPPNVTLPYTSARLRTRDKGDWKYGRLEIRAKLPFGQGTWPAIWMLPTDPQYGGWAASGEIDIMEAVNLGTASDDPNAPGTTENRIHGTLHYGGSWPANVHSGKSARLPGGASPADDFHVYAIEWEAGEIRWYLDDVHYATQTEAGWWSQPSGQPPITDSPTPFDQPFHLLLNVAVGGQWAGNVNEKGIDEAAFPQEMLVDFVRVYACAVDPVDGHGCATIDPAAPTVPGVPPP